MENIEKTLIGMDGAPDDFAAAVRGVSEAALSRRPDEKNWSAKEIVCHVRDTEEYFLGRFEMILTFEEPKFSPADAGRWAAERQYLRQDVGEALAAFRRRRGETLSFLKEVKPGQWARTCVHSIRGRMTLLDYLNLMAGHDKNHLEQIKRALEGKV